MELITGAVSVLFVKVCVPVKVVIFVESAESAIELAGSVTVPVTDNPPLVVKTPLENNLPLNDASEPTNNLEFRETSPVPFKRPFNEISPL